MKDLIAKPVVALMERGWIPESVCRAMIRRLCSQRLVELRREAGEQGPAGVVQKLVQDSMNQPLAPVPEKANEQHYEVPPEFYDLVLGPRKKYSCCFFEDSSSTLAEAEIASLEITCQRAEIENGMDILELGCGWGSLTIWLAEKYPSSHITAVSNSHGQRRYIEAELLRLGLSERVTVITTDMNEFETDQQFDRVVSLEMFEHMRNYQRLLANISRWLRKDGKLFVHVFAHRDFAYEFQTKGAANWMGQYFFTGGIMPSADLFSHYPENLRVQRKWQWSGTHYQRTCAAWRKEMLRNRGDVLEVLASTYGESMARTWLNRWTMFFWAGEELFGFEDGSQWCVMHYLFDQVAKPELTPEYSEPLSVG